MILFKSMYIIFNILITIVVSSEIIEYKIDHSQNINIELTDLPPDVYKQLTYSIPFINSVIPYKPSSQEIERFNNEWVHSKIKKMNNCLQTIFEICLQFPITGKLPTESTSFGLSSQIKTETQKETTDRIKNGYPVNNKERRIVCESLSHKITQKDLIYILPHSDEYQTILNYMDIIQEQETD